MFARKRRTYVKRAIVKYSQKVTVPQPVKAGYIVSLRKGTSFAIEIEFDHCIVSLRSCIEHLLQLINHVANLGLVPTSYRNDRVNIDNVIRGLKSHNNSVLKRLGNYLEKEKQSDWYKMLHKLRIEIYHNKFKRFIAHGKQIKIELPNGQEVDLVAYCDTSIDNLERILTYSIRSLITSIK